MSWWLTDEDRDEEPVKNPVPEQRVTDCVVDTMVGRCPGITWLGCVEPVFRGDFGESLYELPPARDCTVCASD